MSNLVNLPFGDGMLKFELPWPTTTLLPKDVPGISKEEIESVFKAPLGAERLSTLAKGKEKVVILVDDIYRPTPAHKLVPIILKELKMAGVKEENVKIIIAIGAHRPHVGQDLIKKFGREVLSSVEIFNHNPYQNLTYLGVSIRGTPIYINKDIVEADLKIGVGCIIPHSIGFGGGGKIIFPGVAGIESIVRNHSLSERKKDIDEIALKVRVDFLVNVVVNTKLEIAGIFVGDMVAAHRKGITFAKQIYVIDAKERTDIVIANSYPADVDLIQATKVLNTGYSLLKEGGTLVLATPARDRIGYHALYQKGGRLPMIERATRRDTMKNRERKKQNLIIFSPNLTAKEVHQIFPSDAIVINSTENLVNRLENLHVGKHNKIIVTVLPFAPLIKLV